MGATTPARLTGGGDRLRILAHLAWPAIIEQILGTMVSYVDTGMVGVLGATSTAAVAINAASIWLVNGTLAGIGVGYSVQVANAIGAGDPEQARRVIRQAVLATAAAGLAVLAVFQLLASYIPVWLGAKPEVLPYAVEYLRFYSLGLPFAAAVSVFSSILRCMGDTKRPLLFNTAANLLNIVFNFFLIYETRPVSLLGRTVTIPGAGLGVAGAAIASAMALAAAGVLTFRAALTVGGRSTSNGERIFIRTGPSSGRRSTWAFLISRSAPPSTWARSP